jgi:hypothetical protein
MFNFQDIQTGRILSEEEVLEINYVTKRRAHRYVAAAQKDWLYPEDRLGSPHWRRLGDGYLFMPDPRHIHMGGEIIIGYRGGRSEAFDEYGHRPGHPEYNSVQRSQRDGAALERFKAEWSATMGRRYRGIPLWHAYRDQTAPIEEDEELHDLYLVRDREILKRHGERGRRQRLKRLTRLGP